MNPNMQFVNIQFFVFFFAFHPSILIRNKTITTLTDVAQVIDQYLLWLQYQSYGIGLVPCS